MNRQFAATITIVLFLSAMLIGIISGVLIVLENQEDSEIVQESDYTLTDTEVLRESYVDKYLSGEMSHSDLIDSIGTAYLKEYINRYYGTDIDDIKIHASD